MTAPKEYVEHPSRSARLGIKSSMPRVKEALALVLLIFLVRKSPAEVAYSQEAPGSKIEMDSQLEEEIASFLSLYSDLDTDEKTQVVSDLSLNPLFTSQMESLQVALQLVWQLADVEFITSRSNSAERTDGVRFPKKLIFSTKADLFVSLYELSPKSILRVLCSWTAGIRTDTSAESAVQKYFQHCIEESLFRASSDDQEQIIFSYGGLLQATLEGPVSFGEKELVGPTRILSRAISLNVLPLIEEKNKTVTIKLGDRPNLENYLKRLNITTSQRNVRFTDIAAVTPLSLQESKAESYNANKQMSTFPKNLLLYGVPGSGKSYVIKTHFCDDEERIERVVFHPDYLYADFVGQILPAVKEGQVNYAFRAGPFSRILKKALADPRQEYFLIIEEINRGNAPAIFGDIFQLLDRDQSGSSQYSISNIDLSLYLFGDEGLKVKLPPNLFLIGTMNSSDQNVFTLDTAFQRRWSMKSVENDLDEVPYADEVVLDTSVTWRSFNEIINNRILEESVTSGLYEDKRLGAFFVRQEDLLFRDIDNEIGGSSKTIDFHNSLFAEKVVKYLWDDAFKFNRSKLFDSESAATLDEAIKAFNSGVADERWKIFRLDIQRALDSNIGVELVKAETESEEMSPSAVLETVEPDHED